MNTEFSPQKPSERSLLLAEAEILLEKKLLANLSDEEQQRFQKLTEYFPEMLNENEEWSALRKNFRATVAPTKTEQEWEMLENRINAAMQDFTAKSADQTSHIKKKSAILTLPAFMRYAAVAAVFFVGIALGRFSTKIPLSLSSENSSHSELTALSAKTEQTQMLSESALNAVQNHEVHGFLHDAHLLMLGVMAMNAECGIAHPQTLVAQRERSVELMARAQEIRHNLSDSEQKHLCHVIMQVESALAELAGTPPSRVNASTIRQIQARTDDALCEVNTALAVVKN